MKKTNQFGFTLIELLVVISIIGLLSTLAVVSLNGARSKSRDAKRMSDLKSISTAMELYSNNQSDSAYPTNTGVACAAAANGQIAGAEAAGALESVCSGATMDIKEATATYLKGVPTDPTNSGTYIYKYEGSSSAYCLSVAMENTGAGAFYTCNTGGQCGPGAAGCTAI